MRQFGIRVFPPQQRSSESIDRKQIAGERSWSFVLVPERDQEELFATFGVQLELYPTTLLDLGASLGLTSHTPDFTLRMGFTRALTRFEPPRRGAGP